MDTRYRVLGVATLVILGLALPIAPATVPPTSTATAAEATASGDTGPVIRNASIPSGLPEADRRDRIIEDGSAIAADSSARRQFTLVLSNRTNMSARTTKLAKYGGFITSQYQDRLLVSLPPGNLTTVRALPWVDRARVPIRSHPMLVSEAPSSINASQLQAAGVTGDDVTVGVIDRGFDPDNPEIASQVAATRAFGATGIENGGNNDHGTAVSATVVDVAPNASLYLAGTGRGTGTSFANAVEWLSTTQDVDVIVYSAGTIIGPEDGTSFTSQTAADAVASGTTFVAAAGNAGQVHWRDTPTDADGNGLLEFASGDEANEFSLSTQRSVTIAVDWNDYPRSDDDYDVYLYRYRADSSDELVGSSTRDQTGTQAPYELIRARLSAGSYYVVIENVNAAGTAPIELTCFRCREIAHQDPEYSISAPAVAEPVIAVGGYNINSGELEPYSSQGPSEDGRRALDVLGPTRLESTIYGTFAGTSASAPVIGGLVALLEDAGGGISPPTAATALTDTATDRGVAGPDPATGFGIVDGYAAVQTLNTSNQPPIADAGGDVTATANRSVTLDASGSTDPDDETLSYQWEQISGPSISTTLTDSQTQTFAAPAVTSNRTLQFRVTVQDPQGATDTDTVNVTVTPAPEYELAVVRSSSGVAVGQTTTATVRLRNVTNGVGGYDLTVATTDSDVLAITNGTLHGTTETSFNTVTRVSDGSQLNLSATNANISQQGTVTLATLTVEGQAPGTATISIVDASVQDRASIPYPISSTTGTQLNVTNSTGPGDLTGNGAAATDIDGDGAYEDVNGDGSLTAADVTALFQLVVNGHPATDGPQLDINTAGDGATAADVTRLFRDLIDG